MKTETVFLADIYRVTGLNYVRSYNPTVELVYVKHALLQHKRNIFGVAYMKDLNTNEKYKLKLSSKVGTLYVSKSSIESFNNVTNNKETDLPKVKVKELGNKYLRK